MSMQRSTWCSWAFAGDRIVLGGHVLHRAPHPLAVARSPRHLADRRGVAAPGVELVVPAGRGDVAPSRSPGAARRTHPGHPSGAGGTADDPYLLREFHTWLGFWQLRAEALALRPDDHLREHARYEFLAAQSALQLFEALAARSIASAAPAVEDGVVELLGGPATHPFQPLLNDRVATFSLRTGLDDAQLRFGQRRRECGRQGADIDRDSSSCTPMLASNTSWSTGRRWSRSFVGAAWRIGDTNVVAFGRDLDVTYRVWSPATSYPPDPIHRDTHTYDHKSGFRPSRVTGVHVDQTDKLP